MPLTVVRQNYLGLAYGGGSACGVACVISVLRSLNKTPEKPAKIFRKICAVPGLRMFGGSPGNIADYLLSQGCTVSYVKQQPVDTPIGSLMELGLGQSDARKLPGLPIMVVDGPPYLIHFLKIQGADPRGHFVVSDGHGRFMDPGVTASLRVGIPTWANFYDTGLTVVVS